MSKNSVTLTTNDSVKICTVSRGTYMEMYESSLCIYGSFDGGTVTIQVSPDRGTTKITQKDIGGTSVVATENETYNIRLGYAGILGQELEIYATITGATNPNITVDSFDNK